MGNWIFDLALMSIAVLLMAFGMYKLLFSASEESRRESALRPKPRFERREAERQDRRQRRASPPQGQERRVSPRR